jgi:AhpD family alkylhydroperoxidase
MAHFVLVACAMCASSHRGDGLTARAAHATSRQRLAGADYW